MLYTCTCSLKYDIIYMKGCDSVPRPKTKTNSQIKNDYARKVYDQLRVNVKKGQKEIIKAHAKNQGESLNGFINRAINETIKNDNDKEQE